MPDIDMLCRFAGADPVADRQVLGMCMSAAIEWYRRAKVPPREGDELYDFWVCNLAAWMYDNRGAGGDAAVVPSYIVTSVWQLRPKRTATEGGGQDQGG